MTESNPTQVILTDDGIKIIKAQSAADNAASGITNLNDPNLMSVIEKQTQASQYAGLTSQYNVILKRAKDANISTTDLTTAYTNLNTFMAAILTDTTKASDVDRNTYKSLTDAYNSALSTVQAELSHSFNTDISNMNSNVSVASQAASSAVIVASQAATTGDNANQAASQAASAANQASSDYKTLSSGVKDGSVVHITTKTVIDSAVIGTAQIVDAAITDAQVGNISANKLTAGTIDFNTITGKNINASNITTGKLDTDRLNVNKLSAVSANLGDVTAGSLKGVDIVADSFSTPNGSFTTDASGAVTASNLRIVGVTNLVYNAALLGGNGSDIPGWSLSNNGWYWQGNIHDGVPSIGWNGTTGAGVWNLFAQTKLHPLNGTTGQPFSASVWFSDFGSDTSLQYAFILGFFDSNGNRIDGSLQNSWNGTGSSQDWRYVTIDNAVAPSNAVSVGLQYWSYNGHGNAEFSSPMLTQTAQSTGYQPDVGNVISAGEIDGSVINGATVNTPNLNLGDNGQLTDSYSVHDDPGWFQPINGTGSLNIAHGYIQSTANIIYYNKLLNGIGGDKWGHWESSTQFVPFPNQANPDTGNVAESTLTPAFLKLDIFNADKSSVKARAYVDGTGLYINDGGTETVVSMLSGYELLSNGMAYLNTGIQMKQDASFTFGNLAMNGYHSISMLDGKTLYFTDSPHSGGSPIEIAAKTFTKSSRLSIKHDITPLSTAESSRLLNAIDVEKFRYTHDGATLKYQYGGVIDDVNSIGSKQYSMPPELLNEDGTGINLDSLTGILIKRVQDQDKMIGKLSMRLTRLEM
ncbi:tail fiber protein [Pediococcus damnosus LMG 28219]|uniref:hypothetical protein n=1 Tax=Pediococcus damnosus TaxID=51663 RepID=UPI00061EBD4A|nr:hypothetical protein [Pediococcus damnosus]KJU75123.1 tail fiber protein [Pediococcus damnosus LMG 28219]